MIGMVVRHDQAVDPADFIKRLLARSGPQSTSMTLPALTRIDERIRCATIGSHLPQSLPILGTPVDAQPRIRILTPSPG
jgi:hypothetical protein